MSCRLVLGFQFVFQFPLRVHKNVSYQHIQDVQHHQIVFHQFTAVDDEFMFDPISLYAGFIWMIQADLEDSSALYFKKFWQLYSVMNTVCVILTVQSAVLQCWKRPSGFTGKVLYNMGEGEQDPPINIITQPVIDEEAQKKNSFLYSKIPGKDGYRSRVVKISKLSADVHSHEAGTKYPDELPLHLVGQEFC